MRVDKKRKKKIIVSGIQPSGKLHIGNYIGAISVWVENQDQFENIVFVADLHALTTPEETKPGHLRARALEAAGLYVACGIDPAKSLIFLQSDVPEHAYLSWILTCCTPLGWLERMTQFKTKSMSKEGVGTGLLTYPALQAADILAYKADLVPVGDDQKQHVEICRDIAARFNHLYGNYLTLPEPFIRKFGDRIMGLNDPTVKMSKSLAETSRSHAVGLLDSPETIKKTFSRAVTDSQSAINFENCSPGVSNLLTIFRCFSGVSESELQKLFEGKSYGFLKREVTDVTISRLTPIRERYEKLVKKGDLTEILMQGAQKAREIASKTVDDVRGLVGVGNKA